MLKSGKDGILNQYPNPQQHLIPQAYDQLDLRQQPAFQHVQSETYLYQKSLNGSTNQGIYFVLNAVF